MNIGATGVFTANITDTGLENAIFETLMKKDIQFIKEWNIAPLTSDQVTISNNGQTLTIQN